MKTFTNILKNSILLPYVYLRLTAMDFYDLFNPVLTRLWNFFGIIKAFKVFCSLALIFFEIKLCRVMYLTITQMPIPNIVVGVFFTMLLPVFLISLWEIKD
jgi:hypothetical protein